MEGNKQNNGKEQLDYNNIPTGDYQFHIYIERTQGLINPLDKFQPVKPIISIETLGEKKYSNPKKEEVGNEEVYWGEHIYIQKNIKEKKEIEQEKITISVLNHNAILSDQMIGYYELDLITIYFSPNHSMVHQWLALSNMQKNYQEIKGFIKVNIQIVGGTDKQIVLEDEKVQPGQKLSTQGNVPSSNVLYPTQIKKKPYQLVIQLIKAECLPVRDLIIGTIDPVFLIECADQKISTKKISNNQNPVWNQDIFIPLLMPTISKHLKFQLYDYDFIKKDELVGSNYISIQDILDGKKENEFWMNIYGSHDQGNSDQKNIMNNNPELGTCWCGRALLSIAAKKCEKPILDIKPMSPRDIKWYKFEDFVTYIILVDIYFGINIPTDSGNYKVRLQWANLESSTNQIEASNGLVEFYQRLQIKKSLPYKSSDELPDVFIYLMSNDGKPISYLRKKAKDFIYQNYRVEDQPQYYFLNPDKSLTNIRIDQAGILKMKISIAYIENEQALATMAPPQFPKINKNQKGTLLINLFQGKELIPQDDDGTSDPNVLVNFNGQQYKFPTKDNTLNPIWNQSAILQGKVIDIQDPPPIIIKLFDEDLLGEDFMGSCMINAREWMKYRYFVVNELERPRPGWIDLKFNANSQCGKVLLSFQYFDENYQEKLYKSIDTQIWPDVEKYHIQIIVLGLRDLKSNSILPVQRAFVKFDMNSIKLFDKEGNKQNDSNIVTPPKELGSDPNICAILQQVMYLPKDPVYAPAISCIVYDQIFKGLIQPMIGVFAIDLTSYIDKTKERLKNKLGKLQKRDQVNREAQAILKAHESPNVKKFTYQALTDKPKIQQNQSQPQQILQVNQEQRQRKSIFDSKRVSISSQTPLQQQQDSQQNIAIQINQIQNTQPPPQSPGQQIEIKSINANAQQQQQSLQVKTIKEDVKEGDESKSQIPLSKLYTYKYNTFAPNKSIVKQEGKLNLDNAVFYAMYQYDKAKDEVSEVPESIPSTDMYMGMGFDTRDKQQEQIKLVAEKKSEDEEIDIKIRRHYRFLLKKPLEESQFLAQPAFDQIELKRGKRFQEKNYFEIVTQKLSNQQNVGFFKGFINVFNQEQMQLFKTNPDLRRSYERLEQQFLQQTPVLVRIYIVDAYGLPDLDLGSHSDPFLKIQLGEQIISTQNDHKDDQTNPQFYQLFEMKAKMPGASSLKIQIWDYDPLTSDELIGETVIDLESRFYNRKWRKMKYYPIETRELFHPSCSLNRGNIRMWVEIIPRSEMDRINNPFYIQLKPPMIFELRVIVWSCNNMPSMDVEDTSDLYVKGKIDDQVQKTDIHFRCQNGNGNFNWRMLFPITLTSQDPPNSKIITFQAYDKDLLAADDFICSAQLDISEEAKIAYENNKRVKKFGKQAPSGEGGFFGSGIFSVIRKSESGPEYEKFALPMHIKQKSEDDDEDQKVIESEGELVISVELVPIAEAEKDKVGQGRGDPNQNPKLPEPEGRMQLSLNPLTMFNQLVGPRARGKICCYLCSLIAILVFLMVLPNIIGNLIVR